MDTNKLIRLLQDDLSNLTELVRDFDGLSLPSSDEVDLAFVKAKAVARELELLLKITVQHDPISKEGVTFFRPEPILDEPLTTEISQDDKEQEMIVLENEISNDVEEISTSFHPEEHEITRSDGYDSAEGIPFQEEVRLEGVETNSDHAAELKVQEEVGEAAEEEKTSVPEEKRAEQEERPELVSENVSEEASSEAVPSSDVKNNDEATAESNQSMSDLLSPDRADNEFSMLPLSSIWDGIGINDRFLFIRELFSNSSARFETTVNALDKCATIQEAVEYLKNNFKWSKSEASRRFLVLVKRRFMK